MVPDVAPLLPASAPAHPRRAGLTGPGDPLPLRHERPRRDGLFMARTPRANPRRDRATRACRRRACACRSFAGGNVRGHHPATRTASPAIRRCHRAAGGELGRNPGRAPYGGRDVARATQSTSKRSNRRADVRHAHRGMRAEGPRLDDHHLERPPFRRRGTRDRHRDAERRAERYLSGFAKAVATRCSRLSWRGAHIVRPP